MKPKTKRIQENEEKIKNAMNVMQIIANDNTTPRNIRKSVKDAIDRLTGGQGTPGVRAAAAIHILDEISSDPNMPSYSRLRIWNAVSILEAIKD
jgi:uncharacterized protein (UPF0147 family)